MANARWSAVGLGLGWLWGWVAVAGAAEAVPLREVNPTGQETRVLIELKAKGQVLPGAAPGASKESKPLALRVEARLDFAERVIEGRSDGPARRVVRRVGQAAAALNGEIMPTASTLRPEVATLVAELRGGSAFVFSPGGPLTRAELELVQVPGDPLTLAGLLPDRPVQEGDHWTVSDDAARSVSGYDALAANSLTGTLEELTGDSARVRLKGAVRGAVLGGEGAITIAGTLTFDRQANRISLLELERDEVRGPGPVETGVDLHSTLTVERRSAAVPVELTEAALAGLNLDPRGGLDLLRLDPRGGRYTLLHDRDWHIFARDQRQTVLRWLDHGEVVAQCNLAVGPKVGPGRHQDLQQFRNDIRRALGPRFVAILGAGEIDGAPAGGFRFKLDIQGKVGDAGIRWYYYLIAGPEGDQLLVTFTLGETQVPRFGDQDLRLIGSLEWKDAAPPAGP